jgi:non-heme chloroperoxidase
VKYPLNNQSLRSLLGEDLHLPHEIPGQPVRVSDFEDLKLNSFVTSDGVNLAYWEAGTGAPLIFIPGWSANGALYFHLMHILSQHYHVYVLDVRNQVIIDARIHDPVARCRSYQLAAQSIADLLD